MVRGLKTFKKYFEEFQDNYVIIGGTACDLIIDEAGFTPRATKDFDIILVVETLDAEFVKQFWIFIEDGNYELKEKGDNDRKYYRFIKPEKQEFPFQIELFSRNPDLLDLGDDAHLTPIPVDDDLTSLSAILLDDTYYNYLMEHSTTIDKLQLAKIEALICLKAKAFLDITKRISDGSKEESKNLRKHKGDVFRLAVMLKEIDIFDLPDRLKADMQDFSDTIGSDLPDKAIFKEMGLGNTDPVEVYNQIINSFQLREKK